MDDKQTAYVLEKVGLRISGEKTKAMTVGDQTAPPISTITLDEQNTGKVDKFQYLGSYLSEDGDFEVHKGKVV